jgi:hypothetical protein
MTQIKSRLTYANIMSSIAVFLILGGAGAYAAKKNTQKIGTTQLKSSAVTAAKIKNGAVVNSKLGNSAVSTDKLADGSVTNSKLAEGAVSTTKLANDSVTGEKISESTLAEVPSANSANPAVFAHVASSGVVDAANSKGLTSPNVSKGGVGIYCIAVPSIAPRGGQVTPERSAGLVTAANLTVSGVASCAGKLQVETFVGAALTDLGFYVELYR